MSTKKGDEKSSTSPGIVGRALAEADVPGATDAAVAARYGVAPATIATWRHRAPDDPEVLAAYHAASAVLRERWVADALETNARVEREIRRRIEEQPQDVKFSDLLGVRRSTHEALIQHAALQGASLPEAKPRG